MSTVLTLLVIFLWCGVGFQIYAVFIQPYWESRKPENRQTFYFTSPRRISTPEWVEVPHDMFECPDCETIQPTDEQWQCNDCERTVCRGCIITDSIPLYCETCIERRWSYELRNYLGEWMEMRKYESIRKFALERYSLYDLWHEKTMGDLWEEWEDERCERESVPEQEGVQGNFSLVMEP